MAGQTYPAPENRQPQSMYGYGNGPDRDYYNDEDSVQYPTVPPQVVYVAAPGKSNGIGTAGFVLSLCSFIFAIVSPMLIVSFYLAAFGIVGLAIGALLTFLSVIFSFIGLFRKPRGLAIAGFIISLMLIVGFLMMAAGAGGIIAAIAAYTK